MFKSKLHSKQIAELQEQVKQLETRMDNTLTDIKYVFDTKADKLIKPEKKPKK